MSNAPDTPTSSSDPVRLSPFGTTRTEVRPRHALLSPDGFVPSLVPGWEQALLYIVIGKGLGANLNQWLATLPADSGARSHTGSRSAFFYVLEGQATINGTDCATGGFAYLPPGTEIEVSTTGGVKFNVFEKEYEPLPGQTLDDAPTARFGNQAEFPGEPFLGDPDARLQTFLPADDLAFDMAVNHFTYQPGGTLPFVETHVMEHGMLMTSGQGVYRLDDRYYPVQAGDVIWMAPWCPQWYVSMGKTPSSYLYYKDVNRL